MIEPVSELGAVCGTTLFELDLREHLFSQDLLNQCINRRGARHVHEWPPRIDAVVDPWWSPMVRRLDEALGEVGLLCQRIDCLDFKATVEAYVHVRLYDRVLVGGETLPRVGEVPNIAVGQGRTAVEHGEL
jgi:hypothetical protein